MYLSAPHIPIHGFWFIIDATSKNGKKFVLWSNWHSVSVQLKDIILVHFLDCIHLLSYTMNTPSIKKKKKICKELDVSRLFDMKLLYASRLDSIRCPLVISSTPCSHGSPGPIAIFHQDTSQVAFKLFITRTDLNVSVLCIVLYKF